MPNNYGGMSEAAFLKQVCAVAKLRGWDNPYDVLDRLDDNIGHAAAKAYANARERENL